MRTSIFTVGMAYLLTKLGLSQTDTSVQLNNGDQYLRTSIKGASGITELLDSNTKKENGISSWVGRQLENGQYMALEKVRVGFGTSPTTGGTTNPALVKYSTKVADIPAALLNADLEISQSGKTIQVIPMQRFFSDVASDKPAGVADAYELDALRLLEPKQDIGLAIRFPKDGSIATDANYFLEVHLIGAQTGRK